MPGSPERVNRGAGGSLLGVAKDGAEPPGTHVYLKMSTFPSFHLMCHHKEQEVTQGRDSRQRLQDARVIGLPWLGTHFVTEGASR